MELTLEEVIEHVKAGADNVMVQRDYPCDDPECKCTEKNPCWYGVQLGDELDEGQRFQLW